MFHNISPFSITNIQDSYHNLLESVVSNEPHFYRLLQKWSLNVLILKNGRNDIHCSSNRFAYYDLRSKNCPVPIISPRVARQRIISVVAVSRRMPSNTFSPDFVSVYLTSLKDCSEVSGKMTGITHIVYAALFKNKILRRDGYVFHYSISDKPGGTYYQNLLHLVKPTTSIEDLLKTVMKSAVTYFLNPLNILTSIFIIPFHFKKSLYVSGARTPIGLFGGSLKKLSASDLGTIAIREAVNRVNF